MYNRIYIHVPFCAEKCHYCSFTSGKPQQGELAEYAELICNELRLQTPAIQKIASVYFGGGTPSLLPTAGLSDILSSINSHSNVDDAAEITIEANPGTLDSRVLSNLRTCGFNRISMGVQSFDDNMLYKLGRIHSSEQARDSLRAARKAGFDNISLDLIHSLPGQMLSDWRHQLLQAIDQNVQHISIYGLTIEEGTQFATLYTDDATVLPDNDLGADMFELADELLSEAGFEHYEIANYARPGFRSGHNCGYWQRDGYLGLGVAAHSFMRSGYGIRYSNHASLAEYRNAVVKGDSIENDRQILSFDDAVSEYLFLGLRMSDGIDVADFEKEFGRQFTSVFGNTAEDLVNKGMLKINGSSLSLTKNGMLLSNQIFERFLK